MSNKIVSLEKRQQRAAAPKPSPVMVPAPFVCTLCGKEDAIKVDVNWSLLRVSQELAAHHRRQSPECHVDAVNHQVILTQQSRILVPQRQDLVTPQPD